MLFIPAVLLVTFLTIKIVRHNSAEQAQLPAYAQNAPLLLDLSATSQSQRTIFPYSIVPGGVRDARELQSAASHDAVVAHHYSDFHMAAAHTVRLAKPLEMYVSYRRNNQVYWTKNRMVIPAGETLLSDGENLARVRCGNRLSAIAAKPVAVTEPSTEELSTPEFLPPLLAQLLPGEGINFDPGTQENPIHAVLPPGPASGSNTPPRSGFFPPIFPPAVHPLTPVIPPPPPISTPEPGTFLFLFAGATLVSLFVGLTLRRNGSS